MKLGYKPFGGLISKRSLLVIFWWEAQGLLCVEEMSRSMLISYRGWETDEHWDVSLVY